MLAPREYGVDFVSLDSCCLFISIYNQIISIGARPSSSHYSQFFNKNYQKEDLSCINNPKNGMPQPIHQLTHKVPFLCAAEEELSKLRACVASPSLKVEMMLDALKAVRHVYDCINDLLCMSNNQNSLAHSQQLIDRELEESVKLLDICSTSRDNLDVIKSNIIDLELALSRGDSETAKSKMRSYTQLVKMANRDVKMQINKKNESTNEDLLAIVSLLLEAREITISLLQSIFSFLSTQIVGQKSSKWSPVMRLTKKKNVCMQHPEDDALHVTSLLNSVEGLENGLESLFRQIIQCRVSLLNIACNHV